MKTMTEFSSFALKTAVEAADALATSGKTPEELPAALGEQLKLEGDKLTWMVAAIDVARAKNKNLKRILVLVLNEGEAAPKGAEVKEGFVLLPETFPSAHAPAAPQKDDRRDGKRGGKRGDKRGGRDGKPGAGRDGKPGGGERGARGPRRDENSGPRGPRPAVAAGGPKPAPVVIKPKAPAAAPTGDAT
jgi:hypothetical protein